MTNFRTHITAFGALFAMLAALLSAVLAPAQAAAQASEADASEPQLRATSHELVDETAFVASVDLDVADSEIGALSATLDYDTTALSFVECRPDEAVVCNEIDGQVHFAGFDIDGFASGQLLDIEFQIVDRVATELSIDVVTAADVFGGETEPVAAAHGLVSFMAPAVPTGGLNGEVLDASGIGIFGAQVCAVSMTGDQACTVTTGLGAFVLDAVTVGTHTLVVSDPNGALTTTSLVVDVAEDTVTTGLSVALLAESVQDGAPDMQTLDVPAPDVDAAPELPVAPAATAGQIIVQVTAEQGGFAVFGAEVCATMPVIGTQACGFTDGTGVAQLDGLAVGNYELTAADPAGRFDPAAAIFVGMNPGQGINADLALPGLGLGEPPEILAFVDNGAQSEVVGLTMAAGAMAALTAVGMRRRRTGAADDASQDTVVS